MAVPTTSRESSSDQQAINKPSKQRRTTHYIPNRILLLLNFLFEARQAKVAHFNRTVVIKLDKFVGSVSRKPEAYTWKHTHHNATYQHVG
jgi:hypothetical protein